MLDELALAAVSGRSFVPRRSPRDGLIDGRRDHGISLQSGQGTNSWERRRRGLVPLRIGCWQLSQMRVDILKARFYVFVEKIW